MTRNCHAIFAFSGLVLPYTLAAAQESFELDQGQSGEELPKWMHLLRGTHILLYSNWDWLSSGPFRPVLERTKSPIEYTNSPNDFRLAALLPLFKSSTNASGKDATDLMFCFAALDRLRRTCSLPFSPCKTISLQTAVFIWPEIVSPAYLQLLQDQRPEALTVLAHYCVQLHQVDSCWYLRGHAARLVSIIRRNLAPEWLHWIEWPVQEIFRDEPSRTCQFTNPRS